MGMAYTPYIYELNPKVPFSDVLKVNISNNFRITVKGQCAPKGQSFAINVIHDDENEVAYHFRPYYNGSIVQNNCRRGIGWQTEEMVKNEGILPGQPFTIVITSNDQGYETVVNNGKQRLFFKHRVPPPASGFRGVQVKNGTTNDVTISEIVFEVPS